MRTNLFLVSLIAVLTLMVLAGTASAQLVTMREVTVDGVVVSGTGVVSGVSAGQVVPIRVIFDALTDEEDVRVKTWIGGYRADIKDSTGRFDIIENSTYTKHLSLQMPDDIKPSEDYTLVLRVESKTQSDEEEYDLKIQRESYELEILSVETPSNVKAGNSLAIDVVLKNRGRRKLEDAYVTARISSLGTERRVYFGDLVPVDDDNGNDDDDEDDAVERTIFLSIPSEAEAGTYVLEVEANNVDSQTSVTKTVSILGAEDRTDVLSSVTSKTVKAGEEVTYDVVIVNTGSSIKVYSLVPEDTRGISVSVDEPIVTVSGDSSRVVKVRVEASSSADEGTYSFGINVNSDGQLVERVSLNANVKGTAISSPMLILTIVLVIVFIVLLIVLIVLLTRKKPSEELSESYY